MRVEVLFVNTKEFTVRWGRRIRSSFRRHSFRAVCRSGAARSLFKVNDYVTLIDKIAGMKESYEGGREDRITSVLDQLLMKWISREGKDMFNLQANASDIARGFKKTLTWK